MTSFKVVCPNLFGVFNENKAKSESNQQPFGQEANSLALRHDMRQFAPYTRTYEGRYKSNAFNFFSENVTAIRITFTWKIHTSFAMMRLFFHKVFVLFNILLPTLSKTMVNINVVKSPATTSDH
jgi:hypothetical protein